MTTTPARCAVLLLGLMLAGCGGYTPIRFPAVGAPDMLTRVVADPNFRKLDAASFADAAMLYPVRTGGAHHTIPVGDYLLSRTVMALPPDADIQSLRLASYRSVCAPSRALAPMARCATEAQFVVRTAAGERIVGASVAPDVGPLLVVGDISLPFTWGDPFTDAIHDMSRRTIEALRVEMQGAFAPFARRGT